MIKVKYLGRSPEYLDDFPKECKRSVVGSLHFLRGSLKVITKSELEHIKKSRTDVFKLLIVVEDRSKKKKKIEIKIAEKTTVVKSLKLETKSDKNIGNKKSSKRL